MRHRAAGPCRVAGRRDGDDVAQVAPARSRRSSARPWPSGRFMSRSSRSTVRARRGAARRRPRSGRCRRTSKPSAPGRRTPRAPRRPGLVLDDEDPDASRTGSRPASVTVSSAPPRARATDGDAPSRRRATCDDQGEPDPAAAAVGVGLGGPAAFEGVGDLLGRRARARCRPRRRGGGRRSPSRWTATRRSSRPATASRALSTRLPSTVTRSRVEIADSGGRSPRAARR